MLAGDREAAREKFSDLVATQQRRAVRIAYHYLRDAYDADEAVQDAFVKVFTHITTYREDLPFEVWFTRILVNACLDIGKARTRRLRWVMPAARAGDAGVPDPVAPRPGPEARLMSSERAREIAAAIEQLPDRQRAVFTLCHIAEQSTTRSAPRSASVKRRFACTCSARYGACANSSHRRRVRICMNERYPGRPPD